MINIEFELHSIMNINPEIKISQFFFYLNFSRQLLLTKKYGKYISGPSIRSNFCSLAPISKACAQFR